MLDLIKSGTNNVSLDLDDPPCLLLLNLSGDSLLVDASVHLGPLHLTRVVFLQESFFALGIDEDEGLPFRMFLYWGGIRSKSRGQRKSARSRYLHVLTDVSPAMARVDLVTRELANFGPVECCSLLD